MKLTLKLFALLTLMLLMVNATTPTRYLDPETAALSCETIEKLIAKGYALTSTTRNPIFYKELPEGSYAWGSFTFKLSSPPGRDTGDALVTCYINGWNRELTPFYWETHSEIVWLK